MGDKDLANIRNIEFWINAFNEHSSLYGIDYDDEELCKIVDNLKKSALKLNEPNVKIDAVEKKNDVINNIYDCVYNKLYIWQKMLLYDLSYKDVVMNSSRRQHGVTTIAMIWLIQHCLEHKNVKTLYIGCKSPDIKPIENMLGGYKLPIKEQTHDFIEFENGSNIMICENPNKALDLKFRATVFDMIPQSEWYKDLNVYNSLVFNSDHCLSCISNDYIPFFPLYERVGNIDKRYDVDYGLDEDLRIIRKQLKILFLNRYFQYRISDLTNDADDRWMFRYNDYFFDGDKEVKNDNNIEKC